jgi:hypothetical protein
VTFRCHPVRTLSHARDGIPPRPTNDDDATDFRPPPPQRRALRRVRVRAGLRAAVRRGDPGHLRVARDEVPPRGRRPPLRGHPRGGHRGRPRRLRRGLRRRGREGTARPPAGRLRVRRHADPPRPPAPPPPRRHAHRLRHRGRALPPPRLRPPRPHGRHPLPHRGVGARRGRRPGAPGRVLPPRPDQPRHPRHARGPQPPAPPGAGRGHGDVRDRPEQEEYFSERHLWHAANGVAPFVLLRRFDARFPEPWAPHVEASPAQPLRLRPTG